MSYARFGWGGSDVYVYLDIGGYLCCCACKLDQPWTHYSTDAMIEHLNAHKAAGHHVPDDVISELEADRDENEAFIAAGGRS